MCSARPRERGSSLPSATLYAIRLVVPSGAAAGFFDALAGFGGAVSAFDLAPGDDCQIEAIGPAPDPARLSTILALTAAASGVDEPAVSVEALPDIDWLAENRRSFQPIVAGRFLVHPSHERPSAPGRIALRIDAGEAFGTGEHESTRGCLLALDRLARRWRAPRGACALDVGCGTAILALAMARAWHLPVLAVDSAPEAVRVAQANARANGVAALVRVARSDGYRTRTVRRRRYDLVAANILQRPLMAMAPALARQVRQGAWVVLSGFYRDQAQAVIAAHRARGLALEHIVTLGAWSTVVLRKR